MTFWQHNCYFFRQSLNWIYDPSRHSIVWNWETFWEAQGRWNSALRNNALVTSVCKALVTFIAMKPFVPSMCYHVLLEIALVLERTLTNVALVRSIIAVGCQVFTITTGIVKNLPTHVTFELWSAFYKTIYKHLVLKLLFQKSLYNQSFLLFPCYYFTID